MRNAYLAALRRWTGTDQELEADVESLRTRRHRRAATSTAAAVAARGIALVISFVTVPLAIGYLGVDRYGVFAALAALSTMFVFADLGLGNGVLNVVSEANGRDDRLTVQRAVSSAAFMLLAVAAVLAVVVAVGLTQVDLASFLNVTDPLAATEVTPAAGVLIALFLIGLPLGVAERIRLALQEGYMNSVASAAGAVAGFAGLLLAIVAGAGLPAIVLATSAGPVLALGWNALRLFRGRRWLRPSLFHAGWATAARLARLGSLFLVLQVAVAVAFQSDVIVAAAVLGPTEAAVYAVTLKLALFAPTMVGLYLINLWPAYAEALARGDQEWVKATLRRSLAIAAATTTVAGVILLLLGQWVIRTWTGGAVEAPMMLLIGAAIWAVVSGTFNAIGILMNAASVILFQVVTAIVMALTSIVLSITLAQQFGVTGIVFGTLIAYVLCTAIPIIIYLPRLMRRIGERAMADA